MSAGPDRAILHGFHRLMFSPADPPAYWRDRYPWRWMLSEAAGVANGEEFNAVSAFLPDTGIDVRRITAPTEILVGDRDAVVRPAGQANPLATMMPNASLTRIPEGGHMLHHTHARKLAAAVERALNLATA